MKLAILGGACAGLVAISGCAGITRYTGLSTETQLCIATAAAEMVQDPTMKDVPMLDKIGLVAVACNIDLVGAVNATIQTAILAADKAE